MSENNRIEIEDWEDKREDILNTFFRLPSVISSWKTIKLIRSEFNFNDDISDQELIEENLWVIKQFRKYVFSKENDIRNCANDPADLLACFEKLLESADEFFSDRKHALYQSMRDRWIVVCIQDLRAHSNISYTFY